MKYYLHDSSAFEDEKVSELYIQFGYEGVGLFYVALEKFAKQEKPIKTSVLKSQLKVGKRLEKCWKFMEEIGLIHSNNGDTFNKQLLNFSENYQIKKEKTRKRVSEWRNNQADTENVTSYERVSNTPKVKESKVKESKVNINKCEALIFPFHSDDFLETFKVLMNEPKWRNKTLNALQSSLNKLSKQNESDAIEMMQNAIAGNYQGLFEPKNKNTAPEPIGKIEKLKNDMDWAMQQLKIKREMEEQL